MGLGFLFIVWSIWLMTFCLTMWDSYKYPFSILWPMSLLVSSLYRLFFNCRLFPISHRSFTNLEERWKLHQKFFTRRNRWAWFVVESHAGSIEFIQKYKTIRNFQILSSFFLLQWFSIFVCYLLAFLYQTVVKRLYFFRRWIQFFSKSIYFIKTEVHL